jgi:hypothetical protein
VIRRYQHSEDLGRLDCDLATTVSVVPDVDEASPAVEIFAFSGHQILDVPESSRLHRVVLPVVGVTAGGEAKALGTAFCIASSRPCVLVTAWHVVDRFIRENKSGLERGPASIQIVLALGASDDEKDLGRPIPVHRVVHHRGSKVSRGAEWLGPESQSESGFQSDIALLTLPLVQDAVGRDFCPDQIGIGFGLPDSSAWTYAFGYPGMRVRRIVDEQDINVLDVQRVLRRSAGHVVRSSPNGDPEEPLVGPSFEADLAMPWGMSGGPVLADDQTVCAAVSLALDPESPNGVWKSHAAGLAPALDLPVHNEPGVGPLTLRELVDAGAVLALGDVPPASPQSPDAEVFIFDNL